MSRRQHGYTLPELSIVLVLGGILATYAAVKSFDTSVFDATNFADQAKATVRYAQKLAIAERSRPVYVSMSATNIQVCYDAACAVPVTQVIGGGALVATAPAGVQMVPSTALFRFSGLGRTNLGTVATIVIADAHAATTLSISIDPETGYVY